MESYNDLMSFLNKNFNDKKEAYRPINVFSTFKKTDLELFRYNISNDKFIPILSNRTPNRNKIASLKDFFRKVKSSYSDYLIQFLTAYFTYLKQDNTIENSKDSYLVAVIPFSIAYRFVNTKVYIYPLYNTNDLLTDLIFFTVPLHFSQKALFSIDIYFNNELNLILSKFIRKKIPLQINFTRMQSIIINLVIINKSNVFIEKELQISSKMLDSELQKIQYKIGKFFDENFSTSREAILFLNQIYVEI